MLPYYKVNFYYAIIIIYISFNYMMFLERYGANAAFSLHEFIQFASPWSLASSYLSYFFSFFYFSSSSPVAVSGDNLESYDGSISSLPSSPIELALTIYAIDWVQLYGIKEHSTNMIQSSEGYSSGGGYETYNATLLNTFPEGYVQYLSSALFELDKMDNRQSLLGYKYDTSSGGIDNSGNALGEYTANGHDRNNDNNDRVADSINDISWWNAGVTTRRGPIGSYADVRLWDFVQKMSKELKKNAKYLANIIRKRLRSVNMSVKGVRVVPDIIMGNNKDKNAKYDINSDKYSKRHHITTKGKSSTSPRVVPTDIPVFDTEIIIVQSMYADTPERMTLKIINAQDKSSPHHKKERSHLYTHPPLRHGAGKATGHLESLVCQAIMWHILLPSYSKPQESKDARADGGQLYPKLSDLSTLWIPGEWRHLHRHMRDSELAPLPAALEPYETANGVQVGANISENAKRRIIESGLTKRVILRIGSDDMMKRFRSMKYTNNPSDVPLGDLTAHPIYKHHKLHNNRHQQTPYSSPAPYYNSILGRRLYKQRFYIDTRTTPIKRMHTARAGSIDRNPTTGQELGLGVTPQDSTDVAVEVLLEMAEDQAISVTIQLAGEVRGSRDEANDICTGRDCAYKGSSTSTSDHAAAKASTGMDINNNNINMDSFDGILQSATNIMVMAASPLQHGQPLHNPFQSFLDEWQMINMSQKEKHHKHRANTSLLSAIPIHTMAETLLLSRQLLRLHGDRDQSRVESNSLLGIHKDNSNLSPYITSLTAVLEEISNEAPQVLVSQLLDLYANHQLSSRQDRNPFKSKLIQSIFNAIRLAAINVGNLLSNTSLLQDSPFFILVHHRTNRRGGNNDEFPKEPSGWSDADYEYYSQHKSIVTQAFQYVRRLLLTPDPSWASVVVPQPIPQRLYHSSGKESKNSFVDDINQAMATDEGDEILTNSHTSSFVTTANTDARKAAQDNFRVMTQSTFTSNSNVTIAADSSASQSHKYVSLYEVLVYCIDEAVRDDITTVDTTDLRSCQGKCSTASVVLELTADITVPVFSTLLAKARRYQQGNGDYHSNQNKYNTKDRDSVCRYSSDDPPQSHSCDTLINGPFISLIPLGAAMRNIYEGGSPQHTELEIYPYLLRTLATDVLLSGFEDVALDQHYNYRCQAEEGHLHGGILRNAIPRVLRESKAPDTRIVYLVPGLPHTVGNGEDGICNPIYMSPSCEGSHHASLSVLSTDETVNDHNHIIDGKTDNNNREYSKNKPPVAGSKKDISNQRLIAALAAMTPSALRWGPSSLAHRPARRIGNKNRIRGNMHDLGDNSIIDKDIMSNLAKSKRMARRAIVMSSKLSSNTGVPITTKSHQISINTFSALVDRMIATSSKYKMKHKYNYTSTRTNGSSCMGDVGTHSVPEGHTMPPVTGKSIPMAYVDSESLLRGVHSMQTEQLPLLHAAMLITKQKLAMINTRSNNNNGNTDNDITLMKGKRENILHRQTNIIDAYNSIERITISSIASLFRAVGESIKRGIGANTDKESDNPTSEPLFTGEKRNKDNNNKYKYKNNHRLLSIAMILPHSPDTLQDPPYNGIRAQTILALYPQYYNNSDTDGHIIDRNASVHNVSMQRNASFYSSRQAGEVFEDNNNNTNIDNYIINNPPMSFCYRMLRYSLTELFDVLSNGSDANNNNIKNVHAAGDSEEVIFLEVLSPKGLNDNNPKEKHQHPNHTVKQYHHSIRRGLGGNISSDGEKLHGFCNKSNKQHCPFPKDGGNVLDRSVGGWRIIINEPIRPQLDKVYRANTAHSLSKSICGIAERLRHIRPYTGGNAGAKTSDINMPPLMRLYKKRIPTIKGRVSSSCQGKGGSDMRRENNNNNYHHKFPGDIYEAFQLPRPFPGMELRRVWEGLKSGRVAQGGASSSDYIDDTDQNITIGKSNINAKRTVMCDNNEDVDLYNNNSSDNNNNITNVHSRHHQPHTHSEQETDPIFSFLMHSEANNMAELVERAVLISLEKELRQSFHTRPHSTSNTPHDSNINSNSDNNMNSHESRVDTLKESILDINAISTPKLRLEVRNHMRRALRLLQRRQLLRLMSRTDRNTIAQKRGVNSAPFSTEEENPPSNNNNNNNNKDDINVRRPYSKDMKGNHADTKDHNDISNGIMDDDSSWPFYEIPLILMAVGTAIVLIWGLGKNCRTTPRSRAQRSSATANSKDEKRQHDGTECEAPEPMGESNRVSYSPPFPAVSAATHWSLRHTGIGYTTPSHRYEDSTRTPHIIADVSTGTRLYRWVSGSKQKAS